jgi:hypothetical protein
MKQQSRALVRPVDVLARKARHHPEHRRKENILNGISGQGIKVH